MWEITLQCCQRGTGDDGGEVASLRLPGALRSQEDTDSFGSVTDPDLVCSAYKLVVLGRGLQTGKEQTVSLCWNLKDVFFSTFAHILYPSKLISLLKFFFFSPNWVTIPYVPFHCRLQEWKKSIGAFLLIRGKLWPSLAEPLLVFPFTPLSVPKALD